MPGAPIWVGLGVGSFGEGAVHAVAVVVGRRTVGGGSDEWMGELDTRPDLDQSGFHRRVGGRHVETEGLDGTTEEHSVAEGLGGGDDDQQTGVGREFEEALGIALFDLAGDRLAAGKSEPAGELSRVGPGSRQLEQGERVAVALRDDLVAHGLIHRAVHVVQQQRPRVVVAQSLDGQLGESGEDVVATLGASCAHDRDPFGMKAAGNETENLGGGVVEPLGVVDDADERLLLGDLGEQRQRGQAHEEPVRRGVCAQSEHRLQRIALRDG